MHPAVKGGGPPGARTLAAPVWCARAAGGARSRARKKGHDRTAALDGKLEATSLSRPLQPRPVGPTQHMGAHGHTGPQQDINVGTCDGEARRSQDAA